MKALAIGIIIAEKPTQKNQTKTLNLDRCSTQSRELNQLIIRLKASTEISISFFTFLPETLENTYPISSNSSVVARGNNNEQQPLALQHLDYLSTNLYDSNLMGAFLKCYNSHARKHTDLLYDSNGCHIDVITS